jgi:hypothetical protein
MTAATRRATMGARNSFMGFYDEYGRITGATRTAPANGDINGSPADHILGIQEASPATPDPDIVVSPGDDVNVAEWSLDSLATRAFIVARAVHDLDQSAAIQGSTVATRGEARMGAEDTSDEDSEVDGFLLIQSRAKKQDATNKGKKAWDGVLLPLVTFRDLGRQAWSSRAAGVDRYHVSPQLATYEPWGLTIADYYNKPFLRRIRISSDYPMHLQTYRGDGIITSVVTKHRPISVAKTFAVYRIPGGGAIVATVSTVTPATHTVAFSSPANIPTGAELDLWYEFDTFVDG